MEGTDVPRSRRCQPFKRLLARRAVPLLSTTTTYVQSAASADNLPAASADRLPATSADNLPAASADCLPATGADLLLWALIDITAHVIPSRSLPVEIRLP